MCYSTHFINEETEEQRSQITCPRSQSQYVSSLDLESMADEQGGTCHSKALRVHCLGNKLSKGIKSDRGISTVAEGSRMDWREGRGDKDPRWGADASAQMRGECDLVWGVSVEMERSGWIRGLLRR